MPKIKAATVPEHREAQRRALMSAARAIVLERGLGALRFGDLADRAQLARPSVYEYFRNKSELIVALVEAEGSSLRDDIQVAMQGAPPTVAAVGTFVRAILELVAGGRHELAFALSAGELDEVAQSSIAAAHGELFALIVPTLEAVGVKDRKACIELLGSIVMTAGQTLRQDRRRRDVIETAVSFAVGGVSGCIHHGPGSPGATGNAAAPTSGAAAAGSRSRRSPRGASR